MYQCEICKISFQSSVGKRRHVESIHLGIRYKCKVCGKGFMQTYSLRNHMRLHTNERPYKCDKCKNSYVAKKDLDRHLLTHLGEAGRPHECQLCHKKFMHGYDLKNHVNIHTGESRTHKCHICEKAFTTGAFLRNHLERHGNLRPFPCDVCGYRSKTKPDLKRHLLTHKTLPASFKCDQCDKKFTQKTYLQVHVKRMHCPEGRTKSEKCIFCEKGFHTRSDLHRHLVWHINEKYYSCVLCGAEFSKRDKRDAHTTRHTAERTFTCGVCNYQFFTAHELKRHEERHAPPEIRLKCEICGKLLRSKHSLWGHHRRLHSTPQIKERHKCGKCGKGYYKKEELKRHLSNNCTAKQACIFCGKMKRIIYGTSLLEHMGKHTGEKPWICRICGFETRTKHYYTQHKNLHN